MKICATRPWGALGILALAYATSACTGDPKGQLMVAVQTDMSVPDDINTLRIEVRSLGGQIARVDNEIRPFSNRGIFMPGTLGLVEGDTKSQQVEIRISSKFKFESSNFTYEDGEDDPAPDGVFRTLREVRTQLPVGKVVSLPVPIQWLCSEDPDTPDSEREYLSQRGDDPRNECPEGQTCISGTCQRNEVDVNDLDEFDPNDPGSGAGGDGTCFNTLGCFSSAQLVQPNMDGCTLTVSSTNDLNIALYTGVRAGGGDGVSAPDTPDAGVTAETSGEGGSAPQAGEVAGSAGEAGDVAAGGTPAASDRGEDPPGAALPAQGAPLLKGTSEPRRTPTSVGGVCFDDGLCLVPLDMSEGTGWTESGGAREIQLPQAVCRRIEQGRVQGIAISNECESKTPSSPVCGDWLDGDNSGTRTTSPSALVSANRPAGFVDDLADGDTQFRLLGGEEGRWISSSGDPEVVMDDEERGNVVRFGGTLEDDQESGDSADGAQFVGLLLDVGQDDAAGDFDASEFAGISFYAKGSRDGERLLVAAPPSALVSEEYGGTCTEDCEIPVGYSLRLTTEWRLYTVTWDQLFQRGETYSEDAISGMQFFPQDAGDFMLYLDDMSLVDEDDIPPPPVEECDFEELFSEFIDNLDDLRDCDPDAQDPCDREIAFDGETFLYVNSASQERAAETLYEEFLSTIDVCMPPGGMSVGAGGSNGELFPHCIPTGDGMGVCSAVGSPYFVDPEPEVVPPVDVCTRSVEEALVDDFEDGDNTSRLGTDWSFYHVEGGVADFTPTEDAAAMGAYGLSVTEPNIAATVPLDPDCIGDIADYQGVGFYARTDAEFTSLVVGLGAPEHVSMADHPAGTCTTEALLCSLGWGTAVDLFSQWQYYEIPFSSFIDPVETQIGQVELTRIVAMLFVSEDYPFQLDQLELLTEVEANVCGDGALDTATEDCDDGNTDDGDGCSAFCLFESGLACGDAFVDADETCDDGNNFGQDGCSASCQIEPGYDCPNPGFECTPCGGPQQQCCGETTGQSTSGGQCTQGYFCDSFENFCTSEAVGPAPCSGTDGTQSTCNPDEVCYQGFCEFCSFQSEFCCEGNTCDNANLACLDSSGLAPEVWGTEYTCTACGGVGEPCCIDNVCNAGLFCNTQNFTCDLG